jgi:hypothetical protein
MRRIPGAGPEAAAGRRGPSARRWIGGGITAIGPRHRRAAAAGLSSVTPWAHRKGVSRCAITCWSPTW